MSYLLRELLNWLSRKQSESDELFQPSLEEFKCEREAIRNREIELRSKSFARNRSDFDFEERELDLLLREIEIWDRRWLLKRRKHKVELLQQQLQQLQQLVLLEQNCNNIHSRPSPAEKRRRKRKEGEDSNDE